MLPLVMRYSSLALRTLSRLEWTSSNGMSQWDVISGVMMSEKMFWYRGRLGYVCWLLNWSKVLLVDVISWIKVAEHSFQVPMPNSPLLLNHSWFGARFLQESNLTTEEFILPFWLRRVLLPWQRGWLTTRIKKWFLFI